MRKTGYVVVKNYSSRIEADLARDALLRIGIQAVVRDRRTPIDAISPSLDLIVSSPDRKRAEDWLKRSGT